jgi:hypothetical protein
MTVLCEAICHQDRIKRVTKPHVAHGAWSTSVDQLFSAFEATCWVMFPSFGVDWAKPTDLNTRIIELQVIRR